MFDLFETRASVEATPRGAAAAYCGPERRSAGSLAWRWLAATLDEIDYGLVLVGDDAQVLHVNDVARAELDAQHPLQLLGRELRARTARDVAPLRAALDGAARGLRKLLALGEPGSGEVSVSVVPLGAVGCDGRRATLVMLGKRQVCGDLAVHGFARGHGLTPGETKVLAALCRGLPPTTIASEHGVAISTVRSQIGAIRAKTGAASIRDLVRLVAALPPLLGALRGGGVSLQQQPAVLAAAA